MMKSIIIHQESVYEIKDAFEWYLRRNPDSASAFELELDRAVHAIRNGPESCSFHEYGGRYRQIKNFPYLVIFEIHKDDVGILAVCHTSRKPGYWSSRKIDYGD
jgi:toxin ParE1/3/4